MNEPQPLSEARKRENIQPSIEARIADREQRRRIRRCFWTRPLGHFRDKRGICLNCGHDADWGMW